MPQAAKKTPAQQQGSVTPGTNNEATKDWSQQTNK